MSANTNMNATAAVVAPKWRPSGLPSQETMKCAIKNLKLHGKWKWAKPSGNATTTAYFVCNEHVGCERLARISCVGGVFYTCMTGEHTLLATHGPRINSTLGWMDEERLVNGLNEGARPAAVRSSLLEDESRRLQSVGVDPLSCTDDGGGLAGEKTMLPLLQDRVEG